MTASAARAATAVSRPGASQASSAPAPAAAGRRATVPAIPRWRSAGPAAIASTAAAATETPVWKAAKNVMSRGPPAKRATACALRT